MTTTTLHDLAAERDMPNHEVWAAAERHLTRPLAEGLNTVTEVCDRWAATDPTRIAFIVRDSADTPGRRWTFADLARVSAQLASALKTLGVSRGDRVAAILPQGIEAHLTALATWRLGAVFVPVYPGFGAAGLAQRIGHSTPSVIVTDGQSHPALLDAIGSSGSSTHVLVVGDSEQERTDDLDYWTDDDFWTLVRRHLPLPTVVATAASDTATLLYTSGTTGIPKGCQLPHSYLVTMQPFTRHTYALRDGDVFASTSSPGWVNGLYSAGFCVSAQGIPRVIHTGRFDAVDWIRILDQERVTYFASAPSAMRQIIPAFHTEGFPSRLRGAACAGEHQGAELGRQWSRFCSAPLQETYGTTEIGLVMATPGYDGNPPEPGSLPPAVPGFEVTLLDSTGALTDADTGIIGIRTDGGPAGCTGYLDAPLKWAERWTDDWYITGDLARRDDDGRLSFLGRDDDLIVTSGYNVGPAEVENILSRHPLVLDVAVLAQPDKQRGSVVRAVVVAAPDSDQKQLTADLKALAREQLGRHAYPRIVDFVDALPRNAAGKMQRRLLRS
ncbi:AMP-binding protein [Rhodococcus sp. BP-316]|uniref:acyl-CoA synthetase n=1 Tax=Rhodococcus sp. BP-316 TaxID=2739445 RepID=UPI001C9A8204|nr:AMP-binding protein [Rhodococcus sp. BP-316]MBY6681803.1 AMP-binding protein [Rhodococcus sp. BP-316]